MHGFISQGNQDVLQVLGSCPHMELCNWDSTWSWKDLSYPHSGTGTLIQCCWGLHWSLCKLVHRSRRLSGWTGFWPHGKCFHKSSVKYRWKSPLCHFEKYWCLFFFFFSGNFHWDSWISEFVMKQNLEAWSHLCQKHGPKMTWYILQRMGPDVRMVHTDSQIDGFQMSWIKDHPLCKN